MRWWGTTWYNVTVMHISTVIGGKARHHIRRRPYFVWVRALCTVQVRIWNLNNAHGLLADTMLHGNMHRREHQELCSRANPDGDREQVFIKIKTTGTTNKPSRQRQGKVRIPSLPKRWPYRDARTKTCMIEYLWSVWKSFSRVLSRAFDLLYISKVYFWLLFT